MSSVCHTALTIGQIRGHAGASLGKRKGRHGLRAKQGRTQNKGVYFHSGMVLGKVAPVLAERRCLAEKLSLLFIFGDDVAGLNLARLN